MKKLIMVISLAFLCCFIVGCQKGEEDAGESKEDVESDIQIIKDIVVDINAAVNVADVEKLMSFYADDAVEIQPNKPASIGKEAIRNGIQQYFDEVIYQEDAVVKAVHVSGDLAFAHITWSGVATPKAGGESRKGNGNLIKILEKQANGAWNCIYSIYSNESLISPTQAD